MYLFLIGPKGSGKTTLGHLVAHANGIPHYSMGNIIRAFLSGEARTEEGLDLASIRVRSRETAWVILQQLFRLAPHGFVLDGFPRYLAHCSRLMDSLRSRGKPFQFVAVHATREVCLQRAMARGREGDRVEKVHHYTSVVEDFFADKGVLLRVESTLHSPALLAAGVMAVLEEIQLRRQTAWSF